jgi:hypothetical protein
VAWMLMLLGRSGRIKSLSEKFVALSHKGLVHIPIILTPYEGIKCIVSIKYHERQTDKSMSSVSSDEGAKTLVHNYPSQNYIVRNHLPA